MHPLLLDLTRGRPGALHALHSALAAAGGPLRNNTDDGVVLTFVWEGGATAVGLHCGLHHEPAAMQRVDGTDVWHHEAVAPHDTYVAYRFVADDPFLAGRPADDAAWVDAMLRAHRCAHADANNPRRIAPIASLFVGDRDGSEQGHDHESILSLDRAPDDHWFRPHHSPEGAVMQFDHHFASLDQTRTITVWTPPSAGVDMPLLVLLDGASFLRLAHLPRALDRAAADGGTDMPVVAFVGEQPVAAVGLAHELVPLLRDRFPVSRDAARTLAGGASLGGLASMHAALTHPDVIGAVLSVSGSYWWGAERDGRPEWLTRSLADHPVPPVRVYQQIGLFEDGPLPDTPGVTHLDANRRFRAALVQQGVEVHYEELSTAHDVCAFRVAVLRGIAALLPG